jgi:hypothetical protein
LDFELDLTFEPWDLAGGLNLAGGFVLGAETSGADVDFSWPSLYHNRSSVDIRQPASGGMLFGMAYATPKGSSFTANIALHRNFLLLCQTTNENPAIFVETQLI